MCALVCQLCSLGARCQVVEAKLQAFHVFALDWVVVCVLDDFEMCLHANEIICLALSMKHLFLFHGNVGFGKAL